LAGPLAARADQSSHDADIQTAVHQLIVQNAVLQSLQTQLEQQRSVLQAQQQLMQLQLRNGMNQQFTTLQQLQIQQQLLLIKSELRELKARKTPHPSQTP
jgi:hypothetical protein